MEEFSLADYMAVLRRWRTQFLATFLILLAGASLFALTWSNYRSTATVEIEQPQVAPIMTTPVGMSASDMPESLADLRISKIEQKISAPASLVDIITKFNLYPKRRAYEPMALVADTMSGKIKLNLVSSVIANPAATSKVSVDQLSAIAFTLAYDYSDPQTARAVLNELVTRFLDEDLKQRHLEAAATSDFLAAQLKALDVSLAEQEQKIAEFENKNGVSGPETLMFNQQAAASASISLQSIDSQLATSEGTEGQLRAQLATVDPYSRVIADGQVLTTPATELKALEAQYATLTAQYGPDHPDVVKVRHQMDALRGQAGLSSGNSADSAALKSQIQDIETNLAAAKQTAGPDNPDVTSLQHQLASLKTQLAAARSGGGSGARGGLKQDADNPAYLQLVAQLQSVEEQHKSLLEQRKALGQQQAKYEAAVIQNPALQQQMQVLARDHDNAELRYRELKEKKLAADMDMQMIQDRKGERLVVISPPDLPIHTHPQRALLLLAGLFIALIGGITAVVIAQSVSQTVLGSQHLASLVGVPPLVTVPHIYTLNEKNRPPHRVMGDLFARRRST